MRVGKGRPSSRGVTLVELAVVLSLLGLVGAIIGTTLLRQQRFYRGASELLGARESVRDAMEVLSTDIRGLTIGDTVRLMADSAMEFFASIGSSVTCAPGAGIDIGLPGPTPSPGNAFTALLSQPDTGDLALFYRPGAAGIPAAWERARIATLGSRSLATICPASTFAVGEGGKGIALTLSASLSSAVGAGTPVRFIRRGRYSLYLASDGEWYLGYRRCDAMGPSQCGAVQPLSGPYRRYSPDARLSGLLFQYFDDGGLPTASPLSLSRVAVTARAESRQRIRFEGNEWRPGDSATVSIAVRNRLP